MPSDSIALPLAEAHALLKQFDCLKADDLKDAAGMAAIDVNRLQQAVFTVAQHSEYQILGVCADSVAQGKTALVAYAKALGYLIEPELEAIEGPTYIKFNPKTSLCYARAYPGDHRGVLIACQSSYDSQLNEMYGHLPLDLFAMFEPTMIEPTMFEPTMIEPTID